VFIYNELLIVATMIRRFGFVVGSIVCDWPQTQMPDS